MKKNAKQSVAGWLHSWALCLIAAATSCQTQHPLVLPPVGPPFSGTASSRLDLVGTGFLKVYSATETRHAGKFLDYYPHTSYVIYTTNGTLLRWVANSVIPEDQSPAVVGLPAGIYTIRAQDDNYGRVMVPVVIAGGQTTTVHLEAPALPSGEQPEPGQAVRLPDGRVVGWQAKGYEKTLP